MDEPFASPDPVVPGRACGACSLCCKLVGVAEIDKPAAAWCPHCAPGKGGCTIYQTRPQQCRTFYCGWLTDREIGEEWRPMRSKIVLTKQGEQRLIAHVDPAFPGAWRREPYYSTLKAAARRLTDQHCQVCVFIARRIIVILPDKDVDLGELDTQDEIRIRRMQTLSGPVWDAYKVAGDVGAARGGDGPKTS